MNLAASKSAETDAPGECASSTEPASRGSAPMHLDSAAVAWSAAFPGRSNSHIVQSPRVFFGLPQLGGCCGLERPRSGPVAVCRVRISDFPLCRPAFLAVLLFALTAARLPTSGA